MSATRHPSAPLLARLATGELPTAAALAVGAHVEGCALCAAQVRAVEATEGQRLAGLPDAPLAADALARTLRRLDVGRSKPALSSPVRLGDVRLPLVLADVGFAPRRWVAPGFWAARARIPDEDGWRLALLHAPAGAKVPWHQHGGDEMIAVLSGAFSDPAVYVQGDFAEHRTGEGHELAVTEDGPCACLIAARGGGDFRGVGGLAAAWLGL
ncbi:cupin domain-containing protein [Phenylobacterium deserti]|uniref:ChrR-like cupin domain-containing protein n=1 Tax=Phenylobacterium deserti TaxID=1914756 RepID=A0A328ARH4_9CAUL|nr:cupin domain-containing protein [Phenylobacterium deserti]RAK57642.1 hypothetical protein DJ018_06870 [Phenylobacterium deserti]